MKKLLFLIPLTFLLGCSKKSDVQQPATSISTEIVGTWTCSADSVNYTDNNGTHVATKYDGYGSILTINSDGTFSETVFLPNSSPVPNYTGKWNISNSGGTNSLILTIDVTSAVITYTINQISNHVLDLQIPNFPITYTESNSTTQYHTTALYSEYYTK